MKRQSLYVLASTLAFTIVLLLGVSGHRRKIAANYASHPIDAAFRDGVFQAKLDIQNGRKPRLTSGRWGTNVDRALFIAGYQQGYRELSEGHRGKLIKPNTAEQAGYWDGMLDGAGHRLTATPFQLDKTQNYRNAGHGYSEPNSDPKKYEQDYRQAYSNGYQQGYYSQQTSYARSHGASAFLDGGSSSASNPGVSKNTTVGSVVGRIMFEGQPPKPTRISMSSDPSCAKQHPGSALNEDFVLGSDGTLGNVVVFVSDGFGSRRFDVPAEPAVFEEKGCVYQPHVIGIRANQKVRVVNSDSTIHNIHPVPANNREWNESEPAGFTLEETFDHEEIAIPVKCKLHSWMRGYIAVFTHPFFAVTGRGGSFDLRNLPPGGYTVNAWHEKLGTLTQKVTVAPGEAKSVDFVFKLPGK